MYKKRWCIEPCFQSLKQRGFNIENSHIKDQHSLQKLLTFVLIAFTLCRLAGKKQDFVQKIKNHGYKKNSFARVGGEFLKDLHQKM